jgi:glutamate dehydrogenase
MSIQNNPKQADLLKKVADLASGGGNSIIDPDALFARASGDDLMHYTPERLLASAHAAHAELSQWKRKTPSVGITTISAQGGKSEPISVITVISKNKPFIYASVMGEVTHSHRTVHLAVHPILTADAKAAGGFRLATPDDDPDSNISLIQLHVSALNPSAATTLTERIKTVLGQVQLVNLGWKPMLEELDSVILSLQNHRSGKRQAERDEAIEFLRWLRSDNFTFLGMRDYIYSGVGSDAKVERSDTIGLGILSDPDVRVLRLGNDAVTTTPQILDFLNGPDFLIVTKANAKSVVHRRAYMDYVGVKRFDADGNVIGELRIVGLFTATAYTGSVMNIPLLRRKVEKVEEYFGFDPESHSGRTLHNTLESYPRDDLFQIDANLLSRFSEQIMELGDRPRVRVLARIDRFDRFVSVIAYVPREEYNSNVREKMSDYLASAFDGHLSAYYPAFPEGAVARIHFIIGRAGGATPKVAQAKLEEEIGKIAERWIDQFENLLPADYPTLNVAQAYQEAFSPHEVIGDMPDIIATANGSPIQIEFYKPSGIIPGSLSLKIFAGEGHLPLSRRVPLLENLGFNVISERTFEIDVVSGASHKPIILHDMELALDSAAQLDLKHHAQVIEDAFISAFHGTVDNDNFNRLVTTAGLDHRQVAVLRAYARYLRQIGIVYSQGLIADTLCKYPKITQMIFELFSVGFDPKIAEKSRTSKLSALREKITEALTDVPNIDEDRTFRRYLNAINSTLRTNYFQTGPDGKELSVLAFKFDPSQLQDIPEPKPFREIFVYGTEVEGVHLRFGKVARGGLRWSDRAQDYRTEVLGLVKAQQVKNAVIVPVGAKGGFFPKSLPVGGSRDEIFNAGKDAYKTFIRTMLSITDNIVGDDVIPPQNTIRLDGDDPYFVVAADKGTATFSDTANALAAEAGFWLDDAFASGGSAGYDHKKMGITARGAWETVKRHFREMDKDIQTEPFTVAGVGDMSGDVFGNGMLLSEKIQLIAAFDHRDIFIDPAPDTDKSFAERKRLFNLPRSSWQDYDKSLLSAGGIIVSRAEKSITLSEAAAAAIGLDKTTATPNEIMTAILKSEVDLLWFGGIGTYIKSSSETNAEAGDRTNDAIRVDGNEIRAKVIGEGANLGMTQRGRIAFALNGGRCNSDAIDNSAGVNSSDIEVNIKIALGNAITSGQLAVDKRNALLASMTDEVAHLVLENNYRQSLAISLIERMKDANREDLGRLMEALEATGQLNRKIEFLPSDSEFSERYANGRVLTRPEIGVLVSYAKLTLFDALIESDLPDDSYFQNMLLGYFPAKMRKTYSDAISTHRLRREIIATVLANNVVNRAGPGFIQRLVDATGASPANVVRAATIVEAGFDLNSLWSAVDALDNKIGGEAQNDLYDKIRLIFTSATHVQLKTSIGSSETIDTAVANLRTAITALRGKSDVSSSDELVDNVPQALLTQLSDLVNLIFAPEVMRIAKDANVKLAVAAESYGAATRIFQIERLLIASNRLMPADHYESLALTRSQNQIASARRKIVTSALQQFSNEKDPVTAWYAADRVRVNSILSQLNALTDSGEVNLARITVAAGLLSDIVELHSH